MSDRLDLNYWRRILKERRLALQDVAQSTRAAAEPVELDQSRVGRLSRMDALASQAMAVESERRRSLELQRIDAALARIDRGNFGVCTRCDQDIPAPRLDADPCAVQCVGCAQATEC